MKRYVVTGGNHGIGYAFVETLVKSGNQVFTIDRSIDQLDELVKKYPKHLIVYPGDLKEEAALESFVALILDYTRTIDGLINNAAQNNRGVLSRTGYQGFMEVLAVNVGAAYYLTESLQNFFNEGASILNLSSTRAHQSQKDTESYTASKGAMLSLTHSLAVSLGPQVRVNAISPGWVNTSNENVQISDQRQQPVGRIGTTKDIVSMGMYLMSEEASFITGQEFIVDGGMSTRMIYHGEENWQFEES